jgi:hypothetical protein
VAAMERHCGCVLSLASIVACYLPKRLPSHAPARHATPPKRDEQVARVNYCASLASLDWRGTGAVGILIIGSGSGPHAVSVCRFTLSNRLPSSARQLYAIFVVPRT